MNALQSHFQETARLVRSIDKGKIAQWLLECGYYPEEYVLPPFFKVKKFKLNDEPYTKPKPYSNNPDKFNYNPQQSQLLQVSYPKTALSDRTFSVIHPRIYHDLVWNLHTDWELVVSHIFHEENEIYSYSFPIPLSSKNEGELSSLRQGRLIYEYLEMCESDLLCEASNFNLVVNVDVKNFYPSVYTHSIAWAIHGKDVRCSDQAMRYDLHLGLRLDKLLQYANDTCTNGLGVGSAVGDLIAEIILSAVDKHTSILLKEKGIKYVGARYKDDYRFLVNSEQEAQIIVNTLQKSLRRYNLEVNERKTVISILPEGLFKEWKILYQPLSNRAKKYVPFHNFKREAIAALKIYEQYPNCNVLERFLSDHVLVNKKTNEHVCKVQVEHNQVIEFCSLLLTLANRRMKLLPKALAFINYIMGCFEHDTMIISQIKMIITARWEKRYDQVDDMQYELLWLAYFIKINRILTIDNEHFKDLLLHRCMLTNGNKMFFSLNGQDVQLYERCMNEKKPKDHLLKHLAIFSSHEERSRSKDCSEASEKIHPEGFKLSEEPEFNILE